MDVRIVEETLHRVRDTQVEASASLLGAET
jgi:hypothetical protein